MHRIDGAGHSNNRFVHEDPASNRPPTEVTDDILNAFQEEIAGVIESAGIALNKADNAQLQKAIAKMIAGNTPIPPATASAATATTDGTAGLVALAASNNTSALNMAATPAGVATQIAALPPSGVQVFTLGSVPATKTAGDVIYVIGYGYWEWVQTAYFTGYRHPCCGQRWDGDIHTSIPGFLIDANGGSMSATSPLGSRLYAVFAENGLLLASSANYIAGAHHIVDNGNGTFKLPDLRNTFARAAAGAADPDSANARAVGSYKTDTFKSHTHAGGAISGLSTSPGAALGNANFPGIQTQATGTAETAPCHTAYYPRLHA